MQSFENTLTNLLFYRKTMCENDVVVRRFVKLLRRKDFKINTDNLYLTVLILQAFFPGVRFYYNTKIFNPCWESYGTESFIIRSKELTEFYRIYLYLARLNRSGLVSNKIYRRVTRLYNNCFTSLLEFEGEECNNEISIIKDSCKGTIYIKVSYPECLPLEDVYKVSKCFYYAVDTFSRYFKSLIPNLKIY